MNVDRGVDASMAMETSGDDPEDKGRGMPSDWGA
jgi:hypothetical protein